MKFAEKRDFDHFLPSSPESQGLSREQWPVSFTRKDAFPSPGAESLVFNTALNGCSQHRSPVVTGALGRAHGNTLLEAPEQGPRDIHVQECAENTLESEFKL